MFADEKSKHNNNNHYVVLVLCLMYLSIAIYSVSIGKLCDLYPEVIMKLPIIIINENVMRSMKKDHKSQCTYLGKGST